MRDELYKLGFSKNEAAIYLLLLNLGTALPSTISRLSNIKRPTAYAVLRKLEERNLVCSYKKGKLIYFVIDDTNKILLQEKERYEAAQKFIEAIKESAKTTPSLLNVSYYKGTEGYREMYEDILKTQPKTVNVLMNLDSFLKGIDPEREKKWTKERIHKKIFARLLLQNTKSAEKLREKDEVSYRETRMLPKKFFFETNCTLYEGKIVLFDTTEEITCICIQNPALYQMFMTFFEITWEKTI